MNKYIVLISIVLLSFMVVMPVYSQKSVVVKQIAKTAVKSGAKTSAKAAGKQVAKDAGKEIAEQYTKRLIRREVMETAEKSGSKTLGSYFITQTKKHLKNQTADYSKSFGSYASRNKSYKNRIKYSRKGNGSKQSLAQKRIKSKTMQSKTLHSGVVKNIKHNEGKEAIAFLEKNKEAAHLIALYCKKEGYEKFMKLSMKERIVAIQKMTKHIYSLPEAERKKILADLTPEFKVKILQTKKLMSSRFPSSKKGLFKGEKGNSDFVLNDSYVWKDKKTGETMTVGELRKKYNIKDPIVIPYRNGEPDFSKYAFGKVKVNYTDDIDYKDLKGLHNQANVKLSNEQWVKQRQHNDAANPARDLIENMTIDGQYKKGCRNTYHETWDGETILIVPDFINDVCTHDGGRALAQIVK